MYLESWIQLWSILASATLMLTDANGEMVSECGRYCLIVYYVIETMKMCNLKFRYFLYFLCDSNPENKMQNKKFFFQIFLNIIKTRIEEDNFLKKRTKVGRLLKRRTILQKRRTSGNPANHSFHIQKFRRKPIIAPLPLR